MMASDSFEIVDGQLVAIENFEYDLDYAFVEKCDILLASDAKHLVLNLSKVTYINSAYIGIIAATCLQAEAVNKTIKIIAPAPVLSYMRVSGFYGGYAELVETDNDQFAE